MIAGFEDRRGPQAEEYGQPLEDRKDKETDSPLKGKEFCWHLDFSLGLDFSPIFWLLISRTKR